MKHLGTLALDADYLEQLLMKEIQDKEGALIILMREEAQHATEIESLQTRCGELRKAKNKAAAELAILRSTKP